MVSPLPQVSTVPDTVSPLPQVSTGPDTQCLPCLRSPQLAVTPPWKDWLRAKEETQKPLRNSKDLEDGVCEQAETGQR